VCGVWRACLASFVYAFEVEEVCRCVEIWSLLCVRFPRLFKHLMRMLADVGSLYMLETYCLLTMCDVWCVIVCHCARSQTS
jgi:hypothetical protein